ncbi:MAG: phosphomannomutase/phosphoglucomutase, partial [Clostridia bacterium]|nr:phosphomannomutase/phosphoglucomutase [Clostridia bacterium]
MNYSHFKSGSDIRGIALGNENDPLYMSDEMIMRSISAFYDYIVDKTGKAVFKVAVGHDSRLSADRIKADTIKVLLSYGCEVIDCGLCTTPAMFMTTVTAGCDCSVQITASHHPKDRNGLKFFTRDGGLDGGDIADILKSASEKGDYLGKSEGKYSELNYLSEYAGILRKMIIDGVNNGDKPLSGLKIIVDAGNGVGGFYASDVLAPLGADINGSLYLDPDGNFPNHAPNPENSEAMKCITDATVETGADFGVIFDTDVDRAACVGKGGFSVNRNRLVALASKVALDSCPGGTIVTDSVTSDGLAEFIKNNGGVHLRFKRGYRNVINKQIELCENGIECPLALETSGHAAFRDNYFLDDGAYLITKLIIEAAALAKEGKSLESLISNLREPVEEKELRFKILSEDFRPEGEKIISLFAAEAENREGWKPAEDNYEGIRINCADGNGWFLLRLSVHDPIIVLNSESDEPDGVRKICAQVYETIKNADNIDLIDIS